MKNDIKKQRSAKIEGKALFSVLRGLFALARPKQWIKNGFVFAPLVFTGGLLDPLAFQKVVIAALLFCLASSATYVINDLRDIEQDRQHPKKSKSRPLAAGVVSVKQAIAFLIFLILALLSGIIVAPKVMVVIGGYIILNLAYSFVLKHQPVIDIFTIALGFVLRVYAGATALEVPVSSWMFITTLCLALYLAAIKRRQEMKQAGNESRKVLKKYTLALIDRYAEMSATGALVFYSMFVMSAKPQLAISIPFVLFGLFRYWFVVETQDGGESPTDALLEDIPLLLTVLSWVGVCAAVIHG